MIGCMIAGGVLGNREAQQSACFEELSRNEMELAGDLDCRRAAMDIELAIDVLYMCAHRIDGDDQFARNLGVGATRDKQAQDALLL